MSNTEITIARVGLGVAGTTALYTAVRGHLVLTLMALLGAALLYYAQTPDKDE